MISDIVIRHVEARDILALRHRMLRQGCPPEAAEFTADNDATTRHYAAFADDSPSEPICCASFMLNTGYQNLLGWQLRGMATATEYQGRGIGSQILKFAESEFRTMQNGVRFLWCNARESAIMFYTKQGWHCVSEVFEIENAGPHRKMIKSLHRN